MAQKKAEFHVWSSASFLFLCFHHKNIFKTCAKVHILPDNRCILGEVTHTDMHILFEMGELKHEARRVERWSNNSKKSVVLLTNNFELSVENLEEIYKRRWAIETLYKQLKQNFPLHFFYGDSVNAIQIQTWVVLIANLLITVLSRSIKRNYAFSQVVTMIRSTLMYYIDFISFM